MEVELASSITLVIISSIMEARDWEIAIKLEKRAALEIILKWQRYSGALTAPV